MHKNSADNIPRVYGAHSKHHAETELIDRLQRIGMHKRKQECRNKYAEENALAVKAVKYSAAHKRFFADCREQGDYQKSDDIRSGVGRRRQRNSAFIADKIEQVCKAGRERQKSYKAGNGNKRR